MSCNAKPFEELSFDKGKPGKIKGWKGRTQHLPSLSLVKNYKK